MNGLKLTQPEALRLADKVEAMQRWPAGDVTCLEVAAELRRLHEVNAELVKALDLAIDSIGRFTSDEGSTDMDFDILDTCIAAITKTQGDNNEIS